MDGADGVFLGFSLGLLFVPTVRREVWIAMWQVARWICRQHPDPPSKPPSNRKR